MTHVSNLQLSSLYGCVKPWWGYAAMLGLSNSHARWGVHTKTRGNVGILQHPCALTPQSAYFHRALRACGRSMQLHDRPVGKWRDRASGGERYVGRALQAQSAIPPTIEGGQQHRPGTPTCYAICKNGLLLHTPRKRPRVESNHPYPCVKRNGVLPSKLRGHFVMERVGDLALAPLGGRGERIEPLGARGVDVVVTRMLL